VFERQAEELLVGLWLECVRYSGSDSQKVVPPDFDSIWGLELVGAEGRLVRLGTGLEFGVGLAFDANPVDQEEGSFVDVSDRPPWSELVGRQVTDARVGWGVVLHRPVSRWRQGAYRRELERRAHPQEIELRFGEERVWISALDVFAGRLPVPASRSLTIVFDEEVAHHLSIGDVEDDRHATALLRGESTGAANWRGVKLIRLPTRQELRAAEEAEFEEQVQRLAGLRIDSVRYVDYFHDPPFDKSLPGLYHLDEALLLTEQDLRTIMICGYAERLIVEEHTGTASPTIRDGATVWDVSETSPWSATLGQRITRARVISSDLIELGIGPDRIWISAYNDDTQITFAEQIARDLLGLE
jgi:hypothetical protein